LLSSLRGDSKPGEKRELKFQEFIQKQNYQTLMGGEKEQWQSAESRVSKRGKILRTKEEEITNFSCRKKKGSQVTSLNSNVGGEDNNGERN